MKVLRTFSRVFVGVIFIFSGFVKGVDPLGTAYRIEDYFYAYGMEWALPLTLFLSISLCTLEFVLGVALILNSRLKELSLVLFSLMIFFTALTLYDAIFEPVADCGCFGDAIKLSNWNTFFKNVVLIFFVSIIFYGRKKLKSPFVPVVQSFLVIITIIAFGGFSIYQYRHLPYMDFRDWKIGNNMAPEELGEAKIYLTYRNIENGETKEYLSPDYPWSDSVWMNRWEFVNQRVDESEVIIPHQLKIEDTDGNDLTVDYINNPDYQLIVIAWDLDETVEKAFINLNRLYKKLQEKSYSMIVLSSALPVEVTEFKTKTSAEYDFFMADDVILKTMIRANPGLILLKNGVIKGKWNYRDFPSYDDLQNTFDDF